MRRLALGAIACFTAASALAQESMHPLELGQLMAAAEACEIALDHSEIANMASRFGDRSGFLSDLAGGKRLFEIRYGQMTAAEEIAVCAYAKSAAETFGLADD